MMTSVVRGGLGIFRIAPPITIEAMRSTSGWRYSTGRSPGQSTETGRISGRSGTTDGISV